MHGLRERARPWEPSGAPRARHVENSTGLQPHFFSTQPAGARAGAPEGGRAPRDHGAVALLARWDDTGLGCQARVCCGEPVDSVAELGTSFDGGLCSLAGCGGMFIFLIDTTHLDI